MFKHTPTAAAQALDTQPRRAERDPMLKRALLEADYNQGRALLKPTRPIDWSARPQPPRTTPAELLEETTRAGGQQLPHLETLETEFGRPLGHIRFFPGQGAICAQLGTRAAAYQTCIVSADAEPPIEVLRHEVTHCLQHEATQAQGDQEVTSSSSAAEAQAHASETGSIDTTALAAPDGAVSYYGGEDASQEEAPDTDSDTADTAQLSKHEVSELKAYKAALGSEGTLWKTLGFDSSNADAYVKAVLQCDAKAINTQLDTIEVASEEAEAQATAALNLGEHALLYLSNDNATDLFEPEWLNPQPSGVFAEPAKNQASDASQLNLASGVVHQANAMLKRLDTYRASMSQNLRLPHVAPSEATISGHAQLKAFLDEQRALLTEPADFSLLSCVEASVLFITSPWYDKAEVQEQALNLVFGYPAGLKTLILHCVGRMSVDFKDLVERYPLLMLIKMAGHPYSRYTTYLEALSDTSEASLLESTIQLQEFCEDISGIVGDTPAQAYDFVEGEYEGRLDFSDPVPEHPAVLTLIDDLATFVVNAHNFGACYRYSQEPQFDEASRETLATDATDAYNKVLQIGVPSIALTKLLNNDEAPTSNPALGETLCAQLNRIQDGMESKIIGLTMSEEEPAGEPGYIDPVLHHNKLTETLTQYDDQVRGADLDLGLNVANSSAAKAFVGAYSLAQAKEEQAASDNTPGRLDDLNNAKAIAAMNKDAMEATLNLLDTTHTEIGKHADDLLNNPATVTRGVEAARLSNQASRAAERLRPILGRTMLGLDIFTVLAAVDVIQSDEATELERGNAKLDLASGLVGTVGSIGTLMGASWASAATPVTLLIAYFKVLYNTFKRMEAEHQLTLYSNRLELLSGLSHWSAKAGSDAKTLGALVQRDPSSDMVAEYTARTRLSFGIIGTLFAEHTDGWHMFEAVQDEQSDWSDERRELHDVIKSDAFTALTSTEVTPDEIAKHHMTVLEAIKAVMAKLEARLNSARKRKDTT